MPPRRRRQFHTAVLTTTATLLASQLARAVTLDNATIAADTTLLLSTTVTNGLHLANDAELHLTPSSLNGSGPLLEFSGPQPLDGPGSVNLDRAALSAPSGTLTIAPTILVHTPGTSAYGTLSGTIVNYGTLSADGPASVLTLPASLANYGTLEARNGGSLILTAPLATPGTIRATDALVVLDYAYTPATLPAVDLTNSRLAYAVKGFIDLASQPALDLATGPTPALHGGALANGTLVSSDDSPLAIVQSGTLYNVTMNAPVAVTGGRRLTVTNSSALNRPSSVSAGGSLEIANGAIINAPLTVSPGGNLSLTNTWRNASTVSVASGTVYVSSVTGFLNTGSITLTDSTLYVSSTATIPNLTLNNTPVFFTGTRTKSPSPTFNVDTPNYGRLTLAGATLNNVTLTSAGDIVVAPCPYTDPAGTPLRTTITGTTLAAPLRIQPGAVLMLSGTLADTTVTVPAGAKLQLSQLLGTGQIDLAGRALGNEPERGQHVTIGPGITTRVTGQASLGFIVNNEYLAYLDFLGPILVDGPSASLDIPSPLTTATTADVRITNGGSFSFKDPAQLKGSWLIGKDAKVTYDYFPNPSVFTTLPADASITLSSPTSRFDALAPLAVNQGALTITAGRNFTTAGTFSNRGTLTVGPHSTFRVTGPFTNTARIDLAGGALQLDNSPTASTLRSQLRTAFNLGRWDGTTGITSSLAASDPTHATAVGYRTTGPSTLLLYTWLGDTNLDGVVNATDLQALNEAALLPQGGNLTWSQGDFNYDGKIDPDDFALFQLGLTTSAGANISTLVPEPTLAVTFAACCLTLLPLRRTRRPSKTQTL